MRGRGGPGLALCGAGAAAVLHGMAAHAAGTPVVAVASRSVERATQRADEIARTARRRPAVVTYEALPAGADAVVVATPPAQHTAHALAALDAGAHVLVETPIATTLADADRLCAHPAAHRIAYGEHLAHAAPVRTFLAHVARLRAGGPLTHLEARCVSPLPTWGGTTTEAWGGGALFDLGVHPVALVLLAAGDDTPVGVTARLAGDAARTHPVDVHADVTIRFASGLRARVVASWAGGPVPSWDAQAASAGGVARLELFPNLTVERDGEPVALPRWRTEPPQIEALGYVDQVRALVACRHDDAPPTVAGTTATFGRLVLEVVCAAYRSASPAVGGSEVALPDTGPRDRTPLQLWRSWAPPTAAQPAAK